MTASVAREAARRRIRPKVERVTASLDLRDAILAQLEAMTGIRFPEPAFWKEPVRFFREILGVEPWPRQIDIMHAIRDYDRVACKAGRRVSKSHTFGGIALCWYCSWPDARAIMSSTTARQVDQILWRELSMMRARSGRCVACKAADPNAHRIPRPCPHSAIIDGEIGQLARTGLKSDDFREIVGFTARQAEAIQGIAGSRLLFMLDEASGIPQVIFEAVEGNRAGGAKALYMGNPTKNEGEFYDAFHSKKLDPDDPESVGYYCLTISSEESPNVIAGKEVIPGLATSAYIREREIEWGRDSALFKVHVLGEFATLEEGRIFSVHAIGEAQKRWREDGCDECGGEGRTGRAKCIACAGTGRVQPAGRLFLGLDPAGATGTGDESVFVPRRGLRQLDMVAHLGLSLDAHLVHILSTLGAHKIPRETPVVVMDREGPVGAALYAHLHGFLETQKGSKPFDLVGVRASDRAVRQPQVYDRVRDELCANLESWMRDGGAILEDAKLAKELHALEWEQAVNGRLKLTGKKDLRKELGRSPDRYDALALACWEPLSLKEDLPDSAKKLLEDDDEDGGIDPYNESGIDPYGHWG